jgi:hypothetical protein
MLFGGAVALALSGAAYAQTQPSAPQANPGTDQINAGAAGTGAASTTTSTSTTTTTTTHHHYHHHYYHHHYTHHHAKTASRRTSSAGEKQATRELNRQQLQGGTMQATSAGGSEGQMNNMPASGTPTGYTAPQTGSQPATPTGTQPANPPSNAPSSATYTQPQGSQSMQPGNAGYQQPQSPNGYQTVPQDSQPGAYMSAPGANGPAGSQGNPVTPTDQKGPTPPDNSSNPGPSS